MCGEISAYGTIGMVGGGVMVVGGLSTCGPSAGLGCGVAAAGGYIAKESSSQAQQGNQALWATYKSSEGQRVLNSFNLQTYPGEADPLKQTGLDLLMLGAGSVAGKILPKALSSAEKSVTQSKAPLTLAPSTDPGRTKVAIAPINTAATTTSEAKDYGVTFFGDDILGFFDASKTSIGKSNGAPSFFMSLQDSALVKNAHDAAVYTGMAPSAQKAYISGGEIYGFSFPTAGMKVTQPTAVDAGGWAHYLQGGNTAVKLDGPNAGYLVTPVKEFVTSGSNAVPPGSTLFKIGDNGEWIPIRRWP